MYVCIYIYIDVCIYIYIYDQVNFLLYGPARRNFGQLFFFFNLLFPAV